MRLLLVEDSADVAEAIAASLARAGYACDIAQDLATAETHDIIVLDISTLPDGDRTPVLMLTARFEISAQVDALDDGADDYLVKLFDLRELEARVRALTRRQAGRVETRVRLGAMAFDPGAQVVRVRGNTVSLTWREMSLLFGHPGHILSKERLFDGLFSFADGEVRVNAVEL